MTAEDFDNRKAFSVAVFYSDNLHNYVCRHVAVDYACTNFFKMVAVALANPGGITRVIATDGGDCTCMEWKRFEGYYPPELKAMMDKAAQPPTPQPLWMRP